MRTNNTASRLIWDTITGSPCEIVLHDMGRDAMHCVSTHKWNQPQHPPDLLYSPYQMMDWICSHIPLPGLRYSAVLQTLYGHLPNWTFEPGRVKCSLLK